MNGIDTTIPPDAAAAAEHLRPGAALAFESAGAPPATQLESRERPR